MFKIINLSLPMLFITLFLNGCSSVGEKNVVENNSPVVVGYIGLKDDKINFSTVIPPSVDNNKIVIEADSLIIEGGLKEFLLKYYKEIKVGQLRVLMIDEDLAKKGVMQYLNALYNNEEVTNRLYVVVVNGEFKKFMNKQMKQQKDYDNDLYRMMHHFRKVGDVTSSHLHLIIRSYYEPYADVYMPLFDISEQELTYIGTAFFDGNRMIGNTTKKEDQVFQLLTPDYSLEEMILDDCHLGIAEVNSKVKYDFSKDYKNLKITIALTGTITEYEGKLNFDTKENRIKILKSIDDDLTTTTKQLISKLQKLSVDPLNIGSKTIKPFEKNMSDDKWHQLWREMNVDVEYKLTINAPENPHLFHDTEE